MFYTVWEKGKNLVKLVESLDDDSRLIESPRIVYSDELIKLGFSKYFDFSNALKQPTNLLGY